MVVVLGRWDESDLAVQAPVVEPVDQRGRGDLEVVDALAWAFLQTSSALNRGLTASARALMLL